LLETFKLSTRFVTEVDGNPICAVPIDKAAAEGSTTVERSESTQAT
jgi:hypothetical protein